MRVVWLAPAKRSLKDQLAYIAQFNPQAALDRSQAVRQAAARLARYPNLGRVGRVEGTREMVIPRTPNLLIYRIDLDRLIVMRFVHGAQDWPNEPE